MNYNKIEKKRELAILIGVKYATLTYVLYKKGINEYYDSFEIPKKSGGSRKISAPTRELKIIQKKLNYCLLLKQEEIRQESNKSNEISFGFEKGKSIVSNAQRHRNKKYVINMDLKDFFESINFGRVKGFFEKNKDFKLPGDLALVVAQLTCYNGSLPQGAPTSPIIANLICSIMDFRILKIAKKFKLNYTRYADDLTFSTNDIHIIENYCSFKTKIEKEINKAGFTINEKKTRIQYYDFRQVVTGLVVNKKISVPNEYYKNTRAMANSLYRTDEFMIEGQVGTIKQLEGRFNFINQIDYYNEQVEERKVNFATLNAREKQYQKFLVYRIFFENDKPLIMTEGKTDVTYIKAALKNLYQSYPELITKINDGTFSYQIKFFRRRKKHNVFLNIVKDGADTLTNVYKNYYVYKENKKNNIDYTVNYFKEISGREPNYPVILIFDNELDKTKGERPIKKFLKAVENNEFHQQNIITELKTNLMDNLFLCTNQLINDKTECEIENLFMPEVLEHKIDGREFDRKISSHKQGYYGKEELSKYVYANYKKIDFSNFKPLLDNIVSIINDYKKEN